MRLGPWGPGGGTERWPDSGYIFKVENARFPERLSVGVREKAPKNEGFR